MMARRNKRQVTADAETQARVKRLRYGSRVVNLAAINATGGGAHINRRDKRRSNARNDWRAEWE
jgi:hypothetical protein